MLVLRPAIMVLMPTTWPCELIKRPTGIAPVDGGVGLDQVFLIEPLVGLQGPPQGADHAHGHRVAKVAQRAADGDHELARLQGGRVAELGDGQPVAVDSENGQVAKVVDAHQTWRRAFRRWPTAR